MICCNKNKNELLTLTGAVYAFVAYLTAFTLEILFIIDLAKRSSGLIAIATSTTTVPINTSSSSSSTPPINTYDADSSQVFNALEQARLTLESMQAHITISCLAISILYFVLFVASLILIVALILRSTFFILIWMCIMTTMYLPEFGLIIYVSIYGWGLETRNGQTELLFYLFRAALNVIFIFRAHRLFKDWNYEKNFFMLKSGNRFTGYDSPYFIGDSLTTTINPVFSSSTLHLDRYDQVRDMNNSPPSNNFFPSQDFHHQHHQHTKNHHHQISDRTRNATSLYAHNDIEARLRSAVYGGNDSVSSRKGFYLPNDDGHDTINYNNNHHNHQQGNKVFGRMQMRPNNSMLSINDNDDYADFEMDLDYRTLTNQRHYHQQQQQPQGSSAEPSSRQQVARLNSADNPIDSYHHHQQQQQQQNPNRSPSGISYSTQSLDRRQFRDMDFGLPEHVILRPLGHQPFDYLQRPGSTSNLNSINNLNTQPSAYLSNKRPAKRNAIDRFA